MKMKRAKKIISVLLTLAIVCGILLAAGRLVEPKYMGSVVEGGMIEEYYHHPKDHDVVFVGDCEVYENFSPQVLWDDYGISSYIRGGAEQLIWQSYYLMEDTLRYEKPKAFVFNVLSMEFNEPRKEEYNRMTIDGMAWSPAKVGAIRASATGGEHFLDYVFPILRYHSRWSDLTEDDFNYFWSKPDVTHQGFLMRCDVKAAENVPAAKPLADYTFGDNAYSYLDKMRELCDRNDVQLILIKAPSLYPAWYPEWDQQIKDYAVKYDLHYYNFLEDTDEIGLDYSVDTYDAGLHLNLTGAEKLSKYFGNLLQTDCNIGSRRGDPALEAEWAGYRRLYEAEIKEQKAKIEKGEKIR